MPTATELLDDDERRVVPDGGRLTVPLRLMDGAGRASDRFNISDAQAQRVLDAREAFRARLSAGMERHRLPPTPGDGESDPRVAAYLNMKRRLGAPKARRQRKPVDPEWLKL